MSRLDSEEIAAIRERWKHEELMVQASDASRAHNERLREAGGFPAPDRFSSQERRRYVRDVTALFRHIEKLEANDWHTWEWILSRPDIFQAYADDHPEDDSCHVSEEAVQEAMRRIRARKEAEKQSLG